MKCPSCKKAKATIHPVIGLVNCQSCNAKHAAYTRPGKLPEFTTDDIKLQRKEYSDDIEQMSRKGELNKKWVDLYGSDEAKKHGFSDTEIKRAKYTYSGDDTYYNENA